MSMFTLTHLTGRRRNDGRTAVVQGFEVQRKTLLIVSWSFAASIIPAFFLSMFISPIFMLAVPLTVAGLAWWGFISRKSDGMNLSRYQAVMDQRKSAENEVYFCFEPLPPAEETGVISRQTMSVISDEEADKRMAPIIVSKTSPSKSRRKRAPQQRTTVLGD